MKKVVLNQPIKSKENDWIGVSTYVDKLDEAIDGGAEIIGVTSDFGTGKSSLISLLKEKNKSGGKRIYTINMWEILSGNSQNSGSFLELHKALLYNIVSQIKPEKSSYLSKRLSKNYGLISIQSSNAKRSFLVVVGIVLVALAEVARRYSTVLQQMIVSAKIVSPDQIIKVEQIISMFKYAGFLVGFVAIAAVLWKSDFIFSSLKSEGNRELDENILIDIYSKEVLRGWFKAKHYVFVVEDLDRTDDPEVVEDFLKQLRKYYFIEQDQYPRGIKPLRWIRSHLKKRNKITFIVCIKPEAQLRREKSEMVLYNKVFDYVVNLQTINVDNYDAILNGLLFELREYLVGLGLCRDCDHATVDDVEGMQWLIRGKKLGIREIKNRLNHALTLYESLSGKFQEKGISFEGCAAVTYLMTEYEEDYYRLSDNQIEEILAQYMKNELDEEVENWGEEWSLFSSPFKKDLRMLIDGKLINANYRTYFYNYPKDSKLYNSNELTVFNSIVYNELPKERENYGKCVAQVSADVIEEAFRKLDQLHLKFPVFCLEEDKIFSVAANSYRENLLGIIDEFPFDQKNFSRFKAMVCSCCAKRGEIRNRESLLADIAASLVDKIEDKALLCDMREELCKTIPDDIVNMKLLFESDNPFLSVEEVKAIDDVDTILQLVNYETMDEDEPACEKIHHRIMQRELDDERYHDFYQQVCLKYGLPDWHDKVIEYCSKFDQIPEELIDIYKSALAAGTISNFDYIKLVESVSLHGKREIALIDEIGWTAGLSKQVCQRLLEDGWMLSYICNQAVTASKEIDFSSEQISTTILEETGWIEDKAVLAWPIIRREILKDSKLIRKYMPLFYPPYEMVSDEELNLVSEYRDAISILSGNELTEEHGKAVASYFSRTYRNPRETYEILCFVANLPKAVAHEVFYNLDIKNVPYGRMSAEHRKELNQAFYQLFDMESEPGERIHFMEHIEYSLDLMEKNLYVYMNDDKALRDEYVRYVNQLKEKAIGAETINNITKLSIIPAYSDDVLYRLYKVRRYRIYVISRILKMKRFELEEEKKGVLWPIYKDILHSEGLLVIKPYMMQNQGFMDALTQEGAYESAGDSIKYYAGAQQTEALINYVFDNLGSEELIDYFTSVTAFKDFEGARCFIDRITDEKDVLASDTVYGNCYEKLVDPGLKGKYTKGRKKLCE